MAKKQQQPKELTAQEKAREQILETLRELGSQAVQDDQFEFGEGWKLPEQFKDDMGGAIKYLRDWVDVQESDHDFSRVYLYRPWDVANALQVTLKKYFGTSGVQKGTFFSNPEVVTIAVGPGKTTQVPWGQLEVPMFRGVMALGSTKHEDFGLIGQIYISAPKKYREEISALFDLIQDTLEKHSIYRGKAINGAEMPEFLDLNKVDPARVIYSQQTMLELNAHIWRDIKKKMVSKRAIVLEGPYGTGKTLAAYLTGRVCEQNQTTFILCRPGRDDLFQCMQLAALYEPAIVFFEDIDTVAQGSTIATMAQLLDRFDGMTAKGRAMMLVMTTNYKDRIVKPMLRPGRLDALIHIGELDQVGVQKLVTGVLEDEGLQLGDIDWKEVYDSMPDFPPAFVKESAERVSRFADARQDLNGEQVEEIITGDIIHAAESMRHQYQLMLDANEAKMPDELGTMVRRTIADVIEHTTGTNERVGKIAMDVDEEGAKTKL